MPRKSRRSRKLKTYTAMSDGRMGASQGARPEQRRLAPGRGVQRFGMEDEMGKNPMRARARAQAKYLQS